MAWDLLLLPKSSSRMVGVSLGALAYSFQPLQLRLDAFKRTREEAKAYPDFGKRWQAQCAVVRAEHCHEALPDLLKRAEACCERAGRRFLGVLKIIAIRAMAHLRYRTIDGLSDVNQNAEYTSLLALHIHKHVNGLFETFSPLSRAFSLAFRLAPRTECAQRTANIQERAADAAA